jgi:hypothetical protein
LIPLQQSPHERLRAWPARLTLGDTGPELGLADPIEQPKQAGRQAGTVDVVIEIDTKVVRRKRNNRYGYRFRHRNPLLEPQLRATASFLAAGESHAQRHLFLGQLCVIDELYKQINIFDRRF